MAFLIHYLYMKRILSLCLILSLCPLLFSQSVRNVVSGISTTAYKNKITVSWNLPPASEGSAVTSLMVYRANKPFTSVEDIKKSTPAAYLGQGSVSFVDSVKDAREYYYAVICCVSKGVSINTELYYDEELDARPLSSESDPYYILLPGVNATVNGQKMQFISKKEYTPLPREEESRIYGDNQMRDQPLPYIDVLGDEEKREKQISPSTEASVRDLFGKKKEITKELLEPYIFEEDMLSPSGGDEYLLFEILKTTFIQEKFHEAVKLLTQFTLQNRNPQVLARAGFYLGQSYYYTQNFPMALTEFLNLEETYPSLAHKWIESTLTLFEK